MKKIYAKELKDFPKEKQLEIWEAWVDDRVQLEIHFLGESLSSGDITEEMFYDILGCSKEYAESTAWFVPSCYYEKHKKDIHMMVKEDLHDAVFDDYGTACVFEHKSPQKIMA